MKYVLAILLFFTAAAAQAQPYVAVMGSHADVQTTLAEGSNVTTFQGAAGYRLNQYLAAEAGYMSVGRVYNTSASWEASGFGLAAVGTLPLSGAWSLVGKAGAYWMESETLTGNPAGPGAVVDRHNLGALGYAAAGVQYDISPEFAVQALVQYLDGAHELERVRFVTFSAVATFR
jgi:hypothetical protein